MQGILGDLLKYKPAKLASTIVMIWHGLNPLKLTTPPATEVVPVPTLAPPTFAEDSWLHFIIDTIRSLEKDTKHVAPLYHIEEEAVSTREKALDLATKLSRVWAFPLLSSVRTDVTA